MRPRPLRLLSIPIVVVAALTACSPGGSRTAGTVGDVVVTDAQVQLRANLWRYVAFLNGQPCGQRTGTETQDAACSRFALGDLVLHALAHRYADQHGLAPDQDQVQRALGNLESSVGKQKVLDDLARFHVTRQQLVDLIGSILLLQDVTQAVTAERIGDEALHDAYREQISRFTTVQLEHILVDTKAEALDAYRRVTAPGATEQTFKDVAEEVSTDTASAVRGGVLGSAVASTYDQDFARAALALSPGGISPPVHTQFGWHVIRMVAKQTTPFLEAKSQLLQELGGTEFQDWVREQATSLGVEINPRYGRWDAQSLTVERIDSTDPGATSASPSGDAAVAPGP